MTRLVLNNTVNVPITGYNRHTEFYDGKMHSSANVSLASNEMYNALLRLSDEKITDIEIDVDENVIYSLDNQNGKITSINEYLDGGHVSLSMNISFTDEEDSENEA